MCIRRATESSLESLEEASGATVRFVEGRRRGRLREVGELEGVACVASAETGHHIRSPPVRSP